LYKLGIIKFIHIISSSINNVDRRGEGLYVFCTFGLFSMIYLIVISSIIKNIRLEPILKWKLLTIGFLSFVIYQNIDFIVTVFLNQGRYPCNLGASCP